MRRFAFAAAVVLADTGLMVAAHSSGLPYGVVLLYAVAVALVVALRYRAPVAALIAALALGGLAGGAYVLLLWVSYQAGREIVSRAGMTVAAGATFGALGVALSTMPAGLRAIPNLISTYVVFVALPLLVGRYLAQHERLVSTLNRHNGQLRRQQELLAEQERLRERLRIARDMHDSLGHRLSLVSIQAAALEVSALPPRQGQAVRQLAQAARGAMNELYDLVGALRDGEVSQGQSLGVDAIGSLVDEFAEAGAVVTLRRNGQPSALSTSASQAAYRVVEEGLTNAVKHAPDQPVTVSLEWEPDALLLTVINPTLGGPHNVDGGHGLSGLAERVRSAGGLLDHRLSEDGFRLFAMLPAAVDGLPSGPEVPFVVELGRLRAVALGSAAAAFMFVLLPAAMLIGLR
jgi:signal transduction histidine kinase